MACPGGISYTLTPVFFASSSLRNALRPDRNPSGSSASYSNEVSSMLSFFIR